MLFQRFRGGQLVHATETNALHVRTSAARPLHVCKAHTPPDLVKPPAFGSIQQVQQRPFLTSEHSRCAPLPIYSLKTSVQHSHKTIKFPSRETCRRRWSSAKRPRFSGPPCASPVAKSWIRCILHWIDQVPLCEEVLAGFTPPRSLHRNSNGTHCLTFFQRSAFAVRPWRSLPGLQ